MKRFFLVLALVSLLVLALASSAFAFNGSFQNNSKCLPTSNGQFTCNNNKNNCFNRNGALKSNCNRNNKFNNNCFNRNGGVNGNCNRNNRFNNNNGCPGFSQPVFNNRGVFVGCS